MRKTALWLAGCLLAGMLAGCAPSKPAATPPPTTQAEETGNQASAHIYIYGKASSGLTDTPASTDTTDGVAKLEEYVTLAKSDALWEAFAEKYPDVVRTEITVTGVEETHILRITCKSKTRTPEECATVARQFAEGFRAFLANSGVRCVIVSVSQE